MKRPTMGQAHNHTTKTMANKFRQPEFQSISFQFQITPPTAETQKQKQKKLENNEPNKTIKKMDESKKAQEGEGKETTDQVSTPPSSETPFDATARPHVLVKGIPDIRSVKFPHPDVFFPGEMKMKDKLTKHDPNRCRMPPLSQLVNRPLLSDETLINKERGIARLTLMRQTDVEDKEAEHERLMSDRRRGPLGYRQSEHGGFGTHVQHKRKPKRALKPKKKREDKKQHHHHHQHEHYKNVKQEIELRKQKIHSQREKEKNRKWYEKLYVKWFHNKKQDEKERVNYYNKDGSLWAHSSKVADELAENHVSDLHHRHNSSEDLGKRSLEELVEAGMMSPNLIPDIADGDDDEFGSSSGSDDDASYMKDEEQHKEWEENERVLLKLWRTDQPNDVADLTLKILSRGKGEDGVDEQSSDGDSLFSQGEIVSKCYNSSNIMFGGTASALPKNRNVTKEYMKYRNMMHDHPTISHNGSDKNGSDSDSSSVEQQDDEVKDFLREQGLSREFLESANLDFESEQLSLEYQRAILKDMFRSSVTDKENKGEGKRLIDLYREAKNKEPIDHHDSYESFDLDVESLYEELDDIDNTFQMARKEAKKHEGAVEAQFAQYEKERQQRLKEKQREQVLTNLRLIAPVPSGSYDGDAGSVSTSVRHEDADIKDRVLQLSYNKTKKPVETIVYGMPKHLVAAVNPTNTKEAGMTNARKLRRITRNAARRGFETEGSQVSSSINSSTSFSATPDDIARLKLLQNAGVDVEKLRMAHATDGGDMSTDELNKLVEDAKQKLARNLSSLEHEHEELIAQKKRGLTRRAWNARRKKIHGNSNKQYKKLPSRFRAGKSAKNENSRGRRRFSTFELDSDIEQEADALSDYSKYDSDDSEAEGKRDRQRLLTDYGAKHRGGVRKLGDQADHTNELVVQSSFTDMYDINTPVMLRVDRVNQRNAVQSALPTTGRLSFSSNSSESVFLDNSDHEDGDSSASWAGGIFDSKNERP